MVTLVYILSPQWCCALHLAPGTPGGSRHTPRPGRPHFSRFGAHLPLGHFSQFDPKVPHFSHYYFATTLPSGDPGVKQE
eukprot:scaffold33951_cov43-Phaeocystis_antarctica.AAC.3